MSSDSKGAKLKKPSSYRRLSASASASVVASIRLSEVPRGPVPKRLRAERATRLQKVYHGKSTELYDSLIKEFENSKAFTRLVQEWRNEEIARHWCNVWNKVPPNNSSTVERHHLEQELENHLRAYDNLRCKQDEDKAEKRRFSREASLKRFSAAKRRRQLIQLMSKQSLEVELDIDDVIERLASWYNPQTLTKLDIASTKDWNNLWKIPKHKLDGIVHPIGNENAINNIEARFEEELIEELFSDARKRILKQRLYEEFQTQRKRNFKQPVVVNGRDLALRKKPIVRKLVSRAHRQSMAMKLLAEPKPRRNRPELSGYNHSDYHGLLFDEELFPLYHRKSHAEGKGNSVQKGTDGDGPPMMSYYLQKHIRKCQSLQDIDRTNREPIDCDVRKELSCFEERLKKTLPIKVYE